MDKRYQVFVSSTFEDLKEERQAVLRAILELDHMPAGMELFPASDPEAWELIREVIDESDYYVVIVGGRYGSLLDETGIGYTETEYNYARQQNKPVIALLHQNPDELERAKTETDPGAWKKLCAFREKVRQNHTCDSWSTADELKLKVAYGLLKAIKRSPGIGWVRASEIPSQQTATEVLKLRDQIALLQSEKAPAGVEQLAQGNDEIEFAVTFTSRRGAEEREVSLPVSVTWDDIVAGVAPTMLGVVSDMDFRSAIHETIGKFAYEALGDDSEWVDPAGPYISDQHIETCIIQLRALGIVEIAVQSGQWRVTSAGETTSLRLRAIRRRG